VSLDTLRPERFLELARRARLDDVLAGIGAAREAGFRGTKVNTVVIRGFNDDELVDLLEFGRDEGVEVRFIEYMDVGGATRWTAGEVIAKAEMLARIEAAFGAVEPVVGPAEATAPAGRFRLPDGTMFGIIASTTEPFCRTCDRGRLTADGVWYRCLYADTGTDLKTPLRSGAGDPDLQEIVRSAWRAREDRGAEERLATLGRGPLFTVTGLRADPHREMHTRGG
jgi:cyclic pyranopterin phosphate synthase